MEGTVTVITSSSFHCLLLHLYSLLIFNETFFYPFWASLVAQMVKNSPAMQETWVTKLGFIQKKTANSNSFSLKICFLQAVLQLILER